MKLVKLILILPVLASFFCITSCGGSASPTPESIGNSSSTTDSGGGLPDAAAGTPLYFSVSTQYDGDSNVGAPVISAGTCYIDPANLAANNITCTITIPEGWLYYSKMTMTVGTANQSLCPRIEFYPYYRRLSTSAVYLPFGATETVDCSKPIAACFDGAAPEMVENFPKYTFLWAPTEVSTKITASTSSSYSLLGSGPYANTHTCNNLPAGSRGADISVGGIQIYESSGGFVDYEARCFDPHQGTLFKIVLTIADEDTDASDTDAGNDEFYDWN